MDYIVTQLVVGILIILGTVGYFVCNYHTKQFCRWKTISISIFVVTLAFYLLCFAWRRNFFVFSEQWFALNIAAVTGGITASILIDSKKDIITFFIPFIAFYLFTFFMYWSGSGVGWNWYIKMPFNVCDISKILLIIFIVCLIFEIDLPDWAQAYMIIFTLLGGVLNSFLNMHLGESLNNFATVDSIYVHISYITLCTFIIMKRMLHLSVTHSLYNMIWISCLFIIFIFTNQIYNYYFLFTHNMKNHWREGTNPLSPIYDLLKSWGLTFEVGSFTSQYSDPNPDKSTYGIVKAFEINILYYVLVLGLTTLVIWGVTELIVLCDKKWISKININFYHASSKLKESSKNTSSKQKHDIKL